MALIFCEGFDKYGPANSNTTVVPALLTAGEWTTAGSCTIVAPLSATGSAVNLGSTATLSKTISAASRSIGGVRFNGTLLGTAGIQFRDAGVQQAAIAINTTGTVSVKQGNLPSGTILGTSVSSITANTTHYLEWDITFSNTGSYQVWMDGASILSGSGDTTATVNSSANAVELVTSSSSTTFDDLYIFDTTGTTNNAVLLTSPRIETQFPNADGAVQFAVGAAILGTSVARTVTTFSTSTNTFRVRPFIPSVNMTLNSISFVPAASNASIQFRPVVYSDSAGAPGSLMSGGSVVTGVTAATAKTMPLTTAQTLVAGTQYWLGHMCDIAVGALLQGLDGSTSDRTGTATFASGAPGTAPATSAAASSVIWGNVAVTGANWYEASRNPTEGNLSYLFDAVIGHEDLYAFPALSAPPSAIYAVAVKASLAKSDAGAKTASVRLKSGSTDSAGTGGTALAPGTSFGWMTSHYERDPNGNVAWTKTALDAAQAGVKVET